ncbi:MAG TPA: hypothetical protein PLZ36_14410 [Armatimonadota bacterium]|nr:hypothetical protein [Armatimonadota bacterium]
MLDAGYAQRSITPPLGSEMEGFNQRDGARRVHDDLYVRVLSLAYGPEEAAIIALDLLFMERAQVDRMKGALGRTHGLLPAQLFLNFSHTHSGPRISRWHYGGAPAPAYLDRIEDALIAAVGAARAHRQPVTLEAGMTATDIPISRRRVNAAGQAEWGPYAAGPSCPALPVCRLRGEDGATRALLFSVSCHPTINHAPVISAEYPGVAVAALNAREDTAGAIFLQGAGGDTKPRRVAVGDDHFRDGDWEDVAAVGEEAAARVIARIADGLQPVRPGLRAAIVEAELPLSPPPSADALAAIVADDTAADDTRRWAADMLDTLACRGALPAVAPVQVHGLRLGDGLRLIGVEGELVSELGALMLRRFPTGVTFPLGYTNGSRLNIPCDRQLPEGGYGVDTAWEYHWPAPLAPGIDAALARALDALAPVVA